MYKGKTVGVVVPAYNEEELIGLVIETMPDFVDAVVVVDDCSQDGTAKLVESCRQRSDRVHLLQHTANQGVGGAIATGYRWCRDRSMDVAVVMAGDAQMDPTDLGRLLDPVVTGQVDYAKGNRLMTGEAWRQVPKVRYLGNAALSLFTKCASGYWHVADSQTGYTAACLDVLNAIDLDKIYKRYGMPNDMLVTLNIFNFRVRDVAVRPVYGIGEKSGIKPVRMIPGLALLIFRLFLKRMLQKYVIRDFHPLVFFYGLAGLLLGICFPLLTVRLLLVWATVGVIPSINALAIILVVLTGLQFLLFAMLFDMEHNRHLK